MTPREARNRIARQACLWAGAGALLGIGLAVAVDVGLEMLLFDASPRDGLVFLLAVGVFGVALASAVPAARYASRIGPALAARHE